MVINTFIFSSFDTLTIIKLINVNSTYRNLPQ